MAAKKEETTEISTNKDAGLKAALSEIQKQFGKEAIISFTDNSARKELEYVSSGSLSLDLALGGKGYPKGRIVELFSEPSCGKTTICLHAVAEVQKQGGKAAYFDLENALDLEYAAKLGVKVDELIFSQPDSGEQALEMANILMKNNAVDIVVFDSVAAMIPRAELEGNIGDNFIGTTARLLSQGLKKIAQSAARANCLVMFVNQTRNKIGVMYGCIFSKGKVLLADGTTKTIGEIVNKKLPLEVLSYNEKTKQIEPKKIINWFNNGKWENLYKVTCEKPYGNGRAFVVVADDHTFITPNGEKLLSNLNVGDEVLVRDFDFYSKEIESFIVGSILGDGSLRKAKRNNLHAQLRFGQGAKQNEYCLWKRSLIPDELIGYQGYDVRKRFLFDFKNSYHFMKYLKYKKKNATVKIDAEFLKPLDLLGVAIWYMDDGSFGGYYEKWGHGKSAISVKRLTQEEKSLLCDKLVKLGLPRPAITKNGALLWSGTDCEKFQKKIAPYVPECMHYKIHPNIVVKGDDIDTFKILHKENLVKSKILKIENVSKKYYKEHFPSKYDLQIEGNANYFVDGVLVHNSPLTTSGGEALKFYATQRLHITRTTKPLEEKGEAVGNETKVKVVKNKVAPPFRIAEFVIEYNKGISIESEVFKLGVKLNIIEKAGSFYSYDPGSSELVRCQGEAKFKQYLQEHPDIKEQLIAKIKESIASGGAEDIVEAEDTGVEE